MGPERRVVLGINVDHPPVVVSHRLLATRQIHERLQLHRRAAGARACPATQEVAALRIGGDIHDRIAKLRRRIKIGPERACLSGREVAFEHEGAGAGRPVGPETRRGAV